MKKISSQISIILRFFGPSQYIINKKKHTQESKKKTKYVLNNYACMYDVAYMCTEICVGLPTHSAASV